MTADAPAPSLRRIRSAARTPYRFTFLLITELILILGFPFAAGVGTRAHIFRLLSLLLFSAVLYTVIGRGRITTVAFILGIPPIAIHVGNIFGYLMRWEVAATAMGTGFLLFVCVLFVRAVVSEPTVTTDTLAGAVSAYMLIGITYGVAYGLIEQVSPGSFERTSNAMRTIQPPELIFFSFVTLTTVGYGDVVPLHGLAKSLTVLESITGVMYPAVLVGRLIGLHVGGKNREL